jgi:hypothetical protein
MRDSGKPVCANSWKLICLDDETNEVFILELTGSALRTASNYVKGYVARQLPLFTNRVSFSLEVVKNNDIRYSELTVKQGEMTARDAWTSKYLPLFKQWRDILEEAPTQSSASAGAGGGFKPLAMN